ncbi:o-succinylbenzoate--CoA ligase [Natronomonas halophila]|uniref:o-succinylbenzoate--CoA ligase n=1 Tax=Natronomonas halophila TaxID=2747817 RepID=UPI0015B5D280|nr:o-succinylbenzoate--CoA ligase [Natronomonas halophila]QLD84997.1 o-succinylbenzoate--CoA ligase [Natronomonas halophila]
MRDWLATRASATPTATAIAAAGDVDRAKTYADLDERVEVLAGRLAARGVGVDDALVVCAETRAEFVELAHAAQRLGAVLVPVNARLSAAELSVRFDRVNPTVVVCEADTEAAVTEATDANVLSVDEPEGSAEALASVQPEPFDLPEWELDNPLVVMFTSGTTGDPKGVVLTMGNVLASATASAFRLGLRDTDCWHVCLPMYHMGGLAPVYRSTLYGTTISVQRDFEPRAALAAMEAAGTTAVSLVPTMLERLLDTDVDAGPLSDLRFVLLGGAACPPDLLERAQNRDVPVAPTYGMTEAASQIATATPEQARRNPETVGNPVMFAELTVVDEAGAICEAGETGELVVTGPMVTPGYLDDEATIEAFTNGGLRTGDLGHRDEEGQVYVHARVDDTIITGGENVDPSEVAAAIRAHEAIENCAVVGLPDEEWGERVATLVVPVDGAETSADAIRDHCRDRLAGYKLPRTIAFAEALPRTASGTVDREAVTARLREADGHADEI